MAARRHKSLMLGQAIREVNVVATTIETTGLDTVLMEFDLCRAVALMFVGQTDEARTILLSHRGKTLFVFDIDMPWEPYVWRTFETVRDAGANHPLMDEIEAQLRAEVAPQEDQNDAQVVRGGETAWD